MKFGLLIDKCAQDSFYIKDGNSYSLKDDKPYSTTHSIGNRTHMSIFQYPYLFGNDGYFINLKKDGLPDIDFDLIFLVRERWFDEFPYKTIYEKYPHARIFGVLKEQIVHDENGRIKALAETEKVILPIQHKYIHWQYSNILGKNTIWLAQPYDVDFLNDTFYKENRTHDIFTYISKTRPEIRIGKSDEFAKYISEKYNVSRKKLQTETWSDFLEEVSNCKFMINLDPNQFPGQAVIQSAILGTYVIGSHVDAANILFKESNTVNFDVLEDIFYKYHTNDNEYIKAIQESYKLVEKIYGISAVKNRILELYEN